LSKWYRHFVKHLFISLPFLEEHLVVLNA